MPEPNDSLLSINLDRLEEDAQEHPKLAFQWGKLLAEAARKAKVAKNNLKLVAAELELEIRKKPAEYGLDKVTEGSVNAVILCDEQYKYQQQLLIKTEHEEDVLKAFCFALSDRKSMIEAEVKLHGQTYWSKPSLSEETEGGKEIAAKKASAGIKVDKKK
jgi:hypothetical protein